MTTTPTPDDKTRTIREYEEAMANRLARLVMEKPTPPIWMILIPVFFVFFAWKLNDYKKGLKNFATNYLVARERAMDLASEAVAQDTPPAVDRLMAQAETLPEKARPLYREWLALQSEHYRNLLLASGATVPEQVRCHYRNKASYLVVSNRLIMAENAFNNALLPEVEGDNEDVLFIAERIERYNLELHRQEVDKIFS